MIISVLSFVCASYHVEAKLEATHIGTVTPL